MILKRINLNQGVIKNLINERITLVFINKRNLFNRPSTGNNEDNNKNQISLDNIFLFNPNQMKILQNKIILSQNHLGIKTTRNDTYLVYQTEESNIYLLGKKLFVLAIFLSVIEIIRRYKKVGYTKYFLYALFGGIVFYSLINPRFSLSKNIRKIELNKSLDMVYITLFNNKMVKIANNDIYLNTNFRYMENFDNKKILLGIKGKNYFTTLRFAYIPNMDLFNCTIRGFLLGHDNKRF